MHAETITKLPLARFAKIMGINPLHFAGVFLTDMHTCGRSLAQYEWQRADSVSREEIARKIRDAEETLERSLNFRLIPSWETDEWRPGHNLLNRHLYRAPLYREPTLITSEWKHFITGGVRAKELVELSTAITWSDEDGDGYFETGTVTATVDFADACEAHLYYPDKDGADAWEIRPITASISGLTLTATFRRENAKLESFDEYVVSAVQDADGATDAHFLEEVDVYRVYNDPQTQARFMWEPLVANCPCNSEVDGCPSCSYHVQTGCLIMRDAELGILYGQPGAWNEDTLVWDSAPWAEYRSFNIVRLNYYAGLREKSLGCPTLEMSNYWAETVAILAAARMDRKICGCTTDYFEQWRDDMAFQKGAGQTSSYWLSEALRNNPFGTRRGEVEAWRRVTAMSHAGVAQGAVNLR